MAFINGEHIPIVFHSSKYKAGMLTAGSGKINLKTSTIGFVPDKIIIYVQKDNITRLTNTDLMMAFCDGTTRYIATKDKSKTDNTICITDSGVVINPDSDFTILPRAAAYRFIAIKD